MEAENLPILAEAKKCVEGKIEGLEMINAFKNLFEMLNTYGGFLEFDKSNGSKRIRIWSGRFDFGAKVEIGTFFEADDFYTFLTKLGTTMKWMNTSLTGPPQ